MAYQTFAGGLMQEYFLMANILGDNSELLIQFLLFNTQLGRRGGFVHFANVFARK